MNVVTLTDMLVQHRERRPNGLALICGQERLTYADLSARVNAVAAMLSQRNIAEGDRVGVMIAKRTDAVVAFLAVVAVGAVVFPIDNHHTSAHLQFILDLTEPKALLVDLQYAPVLAGLTSPCLTEGLIVVDPEEGGLSTLAGNATAGFELGSRPVRVQAPCYLNFTSGTTGRPKAAVTTQANLYWHVRSAVETLNMTSEDVYLSLFPVHGHPHEMFLRTLYLGGCSVLLDGIQPRTVVQAVIEHGVTCMVAVASVYGSLAHYLAHRGGRRLPLRVAESGGMFVNRGVAESFLHAAGVPIVTVWGSTETTGLALAMDLSGRPRTTGRPCRYFETRLVDETDGDAGSGAVGELWVRGPAVCCGYWRAPEETQRCYADGWFRTGDLFRQDEAGNHHFVGRKACMMKVAGMKVSGAEIEDVLSLHPSVQEVAVAPSRDPLHGEAPHAMIVLRPGHDMTPTDVRRYCEKQLARYKAPRIVSFVESLPKSASGKVLCRLPAKPGVEWPADGKTA